MDKEIKNSNKINADYLVRPHIAITDIFAKKEDAIDVMGYEIEVEIPCFDKDGEWIGGHDYIRIISACPNKDLVIKEALIVAEKIAKLGLPINLFNERCTRRDEQWKKI